MLKALFTIALSVTIAGTAFSQNITWGDQHNGTYANPVLPGDFQDPDVIRVGPDYYFISGTKELSPGMLIMTSKDLVNWKMIGHAVPDLTQISPKYNFDQMKGAGRGIWACAIRFNDNKFYIYFTDPDEGIYMTSAQKITGPWAPLKQLLKAPGWDDPCPFWDDNGQAYLVTTNFADGYKIHLFKMNADGDQLVMESDKVIHQSKGSEANKLYKIKNNYYHFYSEVTAEGRVPFMERAANIEGPYTDHRQLMHKADYEPNQGGLVQTEKGEWYFLTHHGKSRWDGRELSLLPVTWVDGWPLWGTPGTDGVSTMVWAGKKPINDLKATTIQTSDDFDGATLSPQWEWYFQPNNERWSLTARPGYMRLYASKPLTPGVATKIPNTLTQRAFRINKSIATVKIDIAHMVDGQIVGLTLLGKTAATIGVVQFGTARHIYFDMAGANTEGREIDVANISLRAQWDGNGLAHFFYSTDGVTYEPFGEPYNMTTLGSYIGARVAIATSNTESGGNGYVDIDWFHYGLN